MNHWLAADNPCPNAPIHIESRIMKNVMSSASEAETGALFHNGQEAAHIRQILKELEREQTQPTRITTDKSTADGFANDRTKIKQSKAMDMRFYWIQDRVSQGQFTVHWQKGSDNLADYFTKHHPPAHHILMRPIYIHTSNLAHTIAPEWKGVLIRDPGLTESQYPVSAIQSYNVHAGQQSGYIPFEHCHLDRQQPACSLSCRHSSSSLKLTI
jgi:hypothetical protein